jgi:hypothetical protein
LAPATQSGTDTEFPADRQRYEFSVRKELAMLMYVFDERWPGAFESARHMPWTTVSVFKVSSTTSIPTIMTWIRHYAEEKIELLLLCAHGNSGYLQLGTGLTQATAHHFSAIADLFESDADGIEIHGCGVGSSTNILKGMDKKNNPVCQAGTYSSGGAGQLLLSAMANAAKTPVKAGLNCQLADAGFDFEGPTVTERPTT